MCECATAERVRGRLHVLAGCRRRICGCGSTAGRSPATAGCPGWRGRRRRWGCARRWRRVCPSGGVAGCATAWRRWSGSGCSRSPAATRTRTMPTRSAPDPLFKLACGRLPASEPDLASQPTLSRLENAVDRLGRRAAGRGAGRPVHPRAWPRRAARADRAGPGRDRRPGPRRAGGGRRTTATTASTCTTRCSSSTATPAS